METLGLFIAYMILFLIITCGFVTLVFRNNTNETDNDTGIEDWTGIESFEEETTFQVKIFGPKNTTRKAAKRFCRIASDINCIKEMKEELDFHENLSLLWIEHAHPNQSIGHIEIAIEEKSNSKDIILT